VVYFQYTCHGKRRGIERRDTQRNTRAQMTCRVPRPRCTKCTKTSLKFLAMRLSPQEPKRCYGLQGTSIQGLWHDKTKRQEVTQDSPPSDPLANDRNRGSGIKRATNTKQAKGSIHILLDRRGLRTREEEERMEPVLFRPTCHGTDEGWTKGGMIHDPNQIIGHHYPATKRHKATPTALSDAVVIARPEGTPW
jgi:hypothetical protein